MQPDSKLKQDHKNHPLLHVTLCGGDANSSGRLHRHFASPAEAGLTSLLEARLANISQTLTAPMQAPEGAGEEEQLTVEVWAAWRLALPQQYVPMDLQELQQQCKGRVVDNNAGAASSSGSSGRGKKEVAPLVPLQLPAPSPAMGTLDLLPVQSWPLRQADDDVASHWPAEHVACMLLGPRPPPGARVYLELHQALRWGGLAGGGWGGVGVGRLVRCSCGGSKRCL
jgi:hypothetical protein